MRRLALILPVLLAACVAPEGGWPDPPQAPQGPVIEIATGGAFNGWARTQVFGNDMIVHESAGPYGADPQRRVDLVTSGTFDRVAAAVAAAAPAAMAAVDAAAPACPDYGMDAVRADPPIGGFSVLGAGCPDPAMDAFVAAVLAAIPTPP